MRATLRLDLLVALVEMPGTAIYLIEPMRKKRVLWEVRVMKASVASDVLVGTAYEPDEKTARKGPPRRRSTTPGAGRNRPGSSTAPPRQNAKKKKYGAALDPTHHQRGCHPAGRNPSTPRQGIKTASASRKIERELDIE